MTDADRAPGFGTQENSRKNADGLPLVVVIDDEPEVHEVTELVLSGLRYRGRRVLLQSVFSAREAKAYLSAHPDVALILMDVVMETDQAGLGLTRYIREELGNEDVQIVLRTGQPGRAPEQDVVSDYNINGYYLKTEMTAQKLCTVVIAALRSYEHIKNIRAIRHTHPVKQPRRLAQEVRIELSRRLERAIVNDAFSFNAQPQVRLADNAVVGIELRPVWHHCAELGLAVSELASVVGEAELITALNEYLLASALKWGNIGVAATRVPFA